MVATVIITYSGVVRLECVSKCREMQFRAEIFRRLSGFERPENSPVESFQRERGGSPLELSQGKSTQKCSQRRRNCNGVSSQNALQAFQKHTLVSRKIRLPSGSFRVTFTRYRGHMINLYNGYGTRKRNYSKRQKHLPFTIATLGGCERARMEISRFAARPWARRKCSKRNSF